MKSVHALDEAGAENEVSPISRMTLGAGRAVQKLGWRMKRRSNRLRGTSSATR